MRHNPWLPAAIAAITVSLVSTGAQATVLAGDAIFDGNLAGTQFSTPPVLVVSGSTQTNTQTDGHNTATGTAELIPGSFALFPRLGVITSISGINASSSETSLTVGDRFHVTSSDKVVLNELNQLTLFFSFLVQITGDGSYSLRAAIDVENSGQFTHVEHTALVIGSSPTSGGFGLTIPVTVGPNGVDGSFLYVADAFAQIPDSPFLFAGNFSKVDGLDPASFDGFEALDANGDVLPGFTMVTGSGFDIPELGATETVVPEPPGLGYFVAGLALPALFRRRHAPPGAQR